MQTIYDIIKNSCNTRINLSMTPFTMQTPMNYMSLLDKHSTFSLVHRADNFYRPQRSWGKVIFSEACVKNSVHIQEQCMLGDTGNKRAVRILLECILVSFLYNRTSNGNKLETVKNLISFKAKLDLLCYFEKN